MAATSTGASPDLTWFSMDSGSRAVNPANHCGQAVQRGTSSLCTGSVSHIDRLLCPLGRQVEQDQLGVAARFNGELPLGVDSRLVAFGESSAVQFDFTICDEEIPLAIRSESMTHLLAAFQSGKVNHRVLIDRESILHVAEIG